MMNGIFKLDLKSVADAAITAAIGAVLVGLVSLVSTSGFSIFTADWGMIYHNMANGAFIAAVVSLGQSLLSTNQGSVLGLTPNQ